MFFCVKSSALFATPLGLIWKSSHANVHLVWACVIALLWLLLPKTHGIAAIFRILKMWNINKWGMLEIQTEREECRVREPKKKAKNQKNLHGKRSHRAFTTAISSEFSHFLKIFFWQMRMRIWSLYWSSQQHVVKLKVLMQLNTAVCLTFTFAPFVEGWDS